MQQPSAFPWEQLCEGFESMDGSFFKRSPWDNQCFQACFPHRRSDRHRHNHPDGCPEDSPASKSKLAVPVCDDARNEPSKLTSHGKSSVSIPVQCVGTSSVPDALPKPGASPGQSMAKKATSQTGRAEAALKIQSAFRGFSVRKSAPLKNLNVILQVRATMEAIRQRMQKPRVVDSIRQSEKERLRISEEIMSLLLRLDTIQGVSSDVREARKSAIRDLVKLQEAVDAIIAGKYADAEANDPAAESLVTPEIASSPGNNLQPRRPDVVNVEVKFEGSSRRPDQVASTAEQKESVCNGPEDYLETRQNMPLSSESETAEKTGNPNCRDDAGGVKEYTIENQGLRFGLVQRDSDPPWTEKDNTRDVRHETNFVDVSKKIDRINRHQTEQEPKDSVCLDHEPDDSILAEGGEELICSADEAHQKQETYNLKSVA